MRNSWSDLFVLGLAQISGQVAIPNLLSIIVSHQQNRLARDNTPINVKEVTASICKIHDYVQTLAKLNLTQTEFAYLRAIALFGAGKRNSNKQISQSVDDLFLVALCESLWRVSVSVCKCWPYCKILSSQPFNSSFLLPVTRVTRGQGRKCHIKPSPRDSL